MSDTVSPLIAVLHDTHRRALAAFAQPAEVLARTYAPGKWTARQMLFHIADTESAFLDRLRRSLADAKPLYWALDPDRWTARLVTPNRDLSVAGHLFDASRRSYLDLVANITTEEWDRTGVHSDFGLLTIRDLVTKCGWHAGHHLGQVEAAIAGTVWVKPN